MSALDRAQVRAWLDAGATVITPNRRLARDLKRDHDDAQQRLGRTVWPAADILPWDAWLARAYDEVQPSASRPLLLASAQQRVLWEQVLSTSGALPPLALADAVAASVGGAWDLLHRHAGLDALARTAQTDEQRAFRDWSAAFAQRLRWLDATTSAQLPVLLAERALDRSWSAPTWLVLAGFGVGIVDLPPATRRLLDALREAGSRIDLAPLRTDGPAATVRRVACTDLSSQWQQVAAWAQDRLRAQPAARIGIVVPDLGAQRDALTAALTDALAPALRVQPDPQAVRAFNVSLGPPLAQAPLVDTALGLLELVTGDLDIARLGSVLRSPFLAHGAPDEIEWSRRARLDRALRDDGRWQVSLEALRRAAMRSDGEGQHHADAAPRLADALTRIARRRSAAPRRQSLSAWIAFMAGVLQDAGFPGTRALDSVEYQTHQRWRELLAGLGALDGLLGPLAFADALARVRRAAADTLFQPESEDVPVQVMGVLESTHLAFDHLWIANLSDERWPAAAQPSPWLSLGMQRAWRLPQAAPEAALEDARRRQDGWLAAAREVVFSHAAREGDRTIAASPLIAAVPLGMSEGKSEGAPEAPPVSLAHRLARRTTLEPLADDPAPPLTPELRLALRGGTRVVTDQSACPFRAFATHRLHAEPLAEPRPGLDAMLRGGLLHATLESFWKGLGSQAALHALDDAARHARVVAGADAALDALAADRPDLVGPRLRELERERLLRAVHAWLEIEDRRPPFTVVTVEARGEIALGGLQLRVRPDRVDRLADGSLAIIDYKTGRVTIGDWLDARPDGPQLPLYATAYADGMLGGDAQPVGALAYVQLRPGETRLRAVAAADGLLPGATVIRPDQARIARPGWAGLMADWRDILARLADEFVRGEAAVAPKSLAKSCRYCALPLLCRVGERASLAARLASEGEADAAPESGDD
jgi:probable DNA repair protein